MGSIVQFKTKLRVAFLGAGVLPAAAVGYVAYRATSTISEGIGERFQQTSGDLLDKIDRFLFERYGDVQAFAANRSARATDDWYATDRTTPLHEAMNSYATLYGIYDLMVMVDPEGKPIACNQNTPAGKPVEVAAVMGSNFKDAPWFTKAMGERFLASPTLTGTVVGDPMHDPLLAKATGADGYAMTFAAPVKDGDGAIIGVWCNWMRWDAVESLVNATYESFAEQGLPSTTLTLLDRTGLVICDWSPSDNDPKAATTTRDPKVFMALNLCERGWQPARDAVAGTAGHGEWIPPGSTSVHHGGFTPERGAAGYPGLGWSAIAMADGSETMSTITAIRTQLMLVLGVASALVLVGAALLASALMRPIVTMTGRLRDIAEGEADLTKRVHDGRRDEFGTLAHWFDAFVARVEQTVAEVRGGASQIDAGSALVSTSTQAVAADATTQASNLDEITKKLNTLSAATVGTNAIVQQATALGDASHAASDRGRKEMARMNEAMQAILEGSGEVSRIIKVIDDIAFQTNSSP